MLRRDDAARAGLAPDAPDAPESLLAFWDHCRETLAGCEAAIRAGNWEHARTLCQDYQDSLRRLVEAAKRRAGEDAQADDEAIALLRDIDARHRRVMGQLEMVMRQVNEERASLGQGLQAMTMQRRFLECLPCRA